MTTLTRRQVLAVSAVAGAGLVLGVRTVAAPKGVKAGTVLEPNVFVAIGTDGFVTVTISKSDMGQGVRTSLAMIVAEELDADWSMVKVVQAEADSKYGGQGTGGSGSVRGMYRPLREAGATARMMLVAAAAKKWGVDASSCVTAKGIVTSGGNKATYGELVSAAASMAVPDKPPLKDPSSFKILGKDAKRLDNEDVVTGKAKYGLDVVVPGMKYAVIARPESWDQEAESYDESAALKIKGVLKVARFGSGIAVLADNTWAAIQGRDALKVKWRSPGKPEVNSDEIRKNLKAAIGKHDEPPAGTKVIRAEYELPFLAHATMEPMNCVAHVKDDSVEVWTGTQVPESAKSTAARAAGVSAGSSKVNVMLLGGGFGRRLQTDFIAEAVGVSKLFKTPVKLMWTREDDMKNDHYRPATHHSFVGAIDGSGVPVFWSHQMAEAGRGGGGRARRAGIYYEIPTQTMASNGVETGVPLGAWRSVENTFMGFVNEAFFDEMCLLAGKDPLDYRLTHMRNDRLKKCLQVAAEKAGWGSPMTAGMGRGIACFSGYGSNIAQVIEVEVKNRRVKVLRVVAAVDCGQVINPLGLAAQVEGATCDALSTALKAQITIDQNGVLENSFNDYDWLRMDEMPKVEVHLIESTESPGGMGEVGYPSVSAALTNAVFAACGKRVRRLPIRSADLA